MPCELKIALHVLQSLFIQRYVQRMDFHWLWIGILWPKTVKNHCKVLRWNFTQNGEFGFKSSSPPLYHIWHMILEWGGGSGTQFGQFLTSFVFMAQPVTVMLTQYICIAVSQIIIPMSTASHQYSAFFTALLHISATAVSRLTACCVIIAVSQR